MAVLEIVSLARCSGGEHFVANVVIDGKEITLVEFERSVIEPDPEPFDIKEAVIKMVQADLKLLWSINNKPTPTEEAAVVVGKVEDIPIKPISKEVVEVGEVVL